MNTNILRVIILLIAIILVIKLVPPLNDAAREYFPEPVLKLIGEEPQGILEQGADRVKELIEEITSS
jgi:hypothetical protein